LGREACNRTGGRTKKNEEGKRGKVGGWEFVLWGQRHTKQKSAVERTILAARGIGGEKQVKRMSARGRQTRASPKIYRYWQIDQGRRT